MTITKEIVILLIVAAIAGAVWWWGKSGSPSESPLVPQASAPASETLDTNNWLIYRNEKYGFEFKYPTNFKMTGIRLGETILGDSFILQPSIVTQDDSSVFVYVPASWAYDAKPDAKSLEDYMNDYRSVYLDVVIHDQEEKKINNASALKQVFSAGDWEVDESGKNFLETSHSLTAVPRGFRYIFFNGKEFIILFVTDPGAWPNSTKQNKEKGVRNEQFLDTVASTFRFL